MTEEEFNTHLKNFSGAANYYRHPLNVIYTDGVKFACGKDAGKCYWLLTLIASYQSKLIEEEFQVWKLTRTGSIGLVVCDDGNGNELIRQNIPYTDFPYSSITLWLVGGIILLPGEY